MPLTFNTLSTQYNITTLHCYFIYKQSTKYTFIVYNLHAIHWTALKPQHAYIKSGFFLYIWGKTQGEKKLKFSPIFEKLKKKSPKMRGFHFVLLNKLSKNSRKNVKNSIFRDFRIFSNSVMRTKKSLHCGGAKNILHRS